MKKRVRRISIIEILASLFIFTMFSSMLFSVSKSFLSDFSFKSSCRSFISKIYLANVLSVSQSDVLYMKIKNRDGRYFVSFNNLLDLKGGKKSFLEKDTEIFGVEKIFSIQDGQHVLVDDELTINAPISSYEQDCLGLVFFSNGYKKTILFVDYV